MEYFLPYLFFANQQMAFAWSKRFSLGIHVMGEAIAALFALREAALLDFHQIFFVGDCLAVCDAINGRNSDHRTI